ncbi:MAG TPA: hypothetical protein VIY48_02555 [Candidatus Paceibacterota bacterium]|jgi:hypothetical protein
MSAPTVSATDVRRAVSALEVEVSALELEGNDVWNSPKTQALALADARSLRNVIEALKLAKGTLRILP